MLCQISGEIPKEPVVCVKSGNIYEKSLIEKYLQENDFKEPITNQYITLEDLISVKQNNTVAPRPPTMSSIPSLLSVFQNEWDSVMLEMFNLKQQYQQVRQQLSHALYQNDASARVIARLIKERDEARRALTDIKETIGTQVLEGANGLSEDVGMTAELLEALEIKRKELSDNRKLKEIPEELVTADSISEFSQVNEIPVSHSEENNGIVSVQFLDGFIATAGNDGKIRIHETAENELISEFNTETNNLQSIVWDNDTKRIFSVSESNSVLCWNPPAQDDFSSWSLAGELPGHSAKITSFSLNHTTQYAATTSLDNTWKFIDTHNGQGIATFKNPDNIGYTFGSFHPDGMLFGAGTADSTVQIWSLKDQSKAADFSGHNGVITSISFSENGYFLAVTSENNEVKLWDLRKQKNFMTITLPSKALKAKFSPYGAYLATMSSDSINVYKNKSWNEPLVSLSVQANDFAFSPYANNIYSASPNETIVRVFGYEN